jgi:hypothetical protein
MSSWEGDLRLITNKGVAMKNLQCVTMFGSLLLAVFVLTGSVAFAETVPLSPGWDVANAPLRSGSVQWSAADAGPGQKYFRVTYFLRGAEPNHRYTVGVHFFDPQEREIHEVNSFGGWKVGGRGKITVEGNTSVILSAWDFGPLITDHRGNGQAYFEFPIPAGHYLMQFTVRYGDCLPSMGVTGGCYIAYRTGYRFGEGFEKIFSRGKEHWGR